MLQVKQIVNHIYTSNTWVLFDDCYDYCWLVDIGDYEKVADALPQGIEVKGVFLTHAHFDHIYGMNDLLKSFPSYKLFTSDYGKAAIYDDKKNFSRYHESPITYDGTDVVTLKDGDEVEIFPDVIMKVFSTPGHCPSCLTYLIDKWIFTGDSYIPGVKVVTKLPRGNRMQAKQSVDEILKLAENKIICPGHGEVKNGIVRQRLQ